MSHVALVVPSVRMAVVAVTKFDDGNPDDCSVARWISPILAIRSTIGPDGVCNDEFLILDPIEFSMLTTVWECYPIKNHLVKTVICSWPPEQDSERLGQIATGMAALAARKANEVR